MAQPVPQRRNLDDVGEFTVSGKAGDFIFREGETSADMYIVLDGQVEILRQWANAPKHLAVMDAGDFFGETALLEELPREVTAHALTDYRLLRIDHSTFDQIVRENPEIAVRMLRRLSQRLRERLNAEMRAAEIAMAPFNKRPALPALPALSERPRVEGSERPRVEGSERPRVEGSERPRVEGSERPRVEGPIAAPPPVVAPSGPPVLVHDSGKEFPLGDADDVLIGRVDRATGKRPPIDLTDIDIDRTLSRQHARIVKRDAGYFVREEAGTRNGTLLNGTTLKPGEDALLTDGDQLRFAAVAVRFQHR